MIVELTASLVMLGEPSVTTFDSSVPVRIERSTIKVGSEGASIKQRVLCGRALRLTWLGDSALDYRVEWSYDLLSWNSNNITLVGTGEPLVFYDDLRDDRKFYRVICQTRPIP